MVVTDRLATCCIYSYVRVRRWHANTVLWIPQIMMQERYIHGNDGNEKLKKHLVIMKTYRHTYLHARKLWPFANRRSGFFYRSCWDHLLNNVCSILLGIRASSQVTWYWLDSGKGYRWYESIITDPDRKMIERVFPGKEISIGIK